MNRPDAMKSVSLIVFDFDGVMTDNRVRVHQSGEEAVWCHRGDGWGIARLKDAGLEVLVLSTESNPVVAARCQKLRVEAIQGCDDKLARLQELARARDLRPSQIAYVGNDVNDLACMQWVGWPIAVADAVSEVRTIARWVTRRRGGQGAVREVADRLVSARLDSDAEAEWAREAIWRSIDVKREIVNSSDFLGQILRSARTMSAAIKAGGRVFFFGNGGSAADAQHLAAELVGRFMLERRALPAMALTVNTSVLTAIANDYTYDLVFARQIEGLARAGDVSVGITTSGNSPNVVRATEVARKMGLHTIALTGARGGRISTAAEECLCVPSTVTSRIQEAHILIGHMLCEYVERAIFDDKPISPEGSSPGHLA